MAHKHFIIPDTLPTKSIKIGLPSKDRLNGKYSPLGCFPLLTGREHEPFFLTSMPSTTRTITTAKTMIKMIHQAIPTRHKPSMIQDKYS